MVLLKVLKPTLEDFKVANLRRRLELLEEEQCRKMLEEFDRDLEGRSLEDVEFFCVHGYLPEVPIPGSPFIPVRMSWKERWEHWKECERQCANRSIAELEFFCAHGYWPPQTRGAGNEKD